MSTLASAPADAYSELARSVAVAGDIVECGVHEGASLAALARGLPGRRVWAYDSFQGFPAPAPGHDSQWVCDHLTGLRAAAPEVMAAAVGPYAAELVVRPGWFRDTLHEQPQPAAIAFLSVDCDLYESVALVLRTFAPLVVAGGVIALDDWRAFVGCRRAFYDWQAGQATAPWLREFGHAYGAVYWRVGDREDI